MDFFRNGIAALTGNRAQVSAILEVRFEKLAKDARRKPKPKTPLH